jgi:ornithine carbamoyltransferase
MLSRFVQCIMARVFAHDTVVELGRHATVPVINGLTDTQHPCQALADVLTMQDRHGRVEGLRVAFVGDGNNVAFSLGQAVAHLGGHFAIATPEGYAFSEDDAETIAQTAALNGSTFETFHDPVKAVRDADVIYTDTFGGVRPGGKPPACAKSDPGEADGPPDAVNATNSVAQPRGGLTGADDGHSSELECGRCRAIVRYTNSR